MRQRFMRSVMLMGSLLLLSTGVPASSSTTPAADAPASSSAASQTLNAHAIRTELSKILAQAEARKGAYKRMRDADLESLSQYARVVRRLLPPQVSRVDELNEHDQIAVFNSLQAIQALVNRVEDERLICERYKPTGTKRPLTVCRSVAERKLDRENVDNEIARRFQFCIKKPDGTCE